MGREVMSRPFGVSYFVAFMSVCYKVSMTSICSSVPASGIPAHVSPFSFL